MISIAIFAKKVEKGHRSDGTLKHWRTAKSKVVEFLFRKYKIDNIKVKDIKYRHAEEFFDYLILDAPETIAETTAKGYFKRFRQILGICATRDFIAKNPFANFVCSVVEPEVEPLELYQVEAIYNKAIAVPRLDEVRDAFIVQCFTGFAFQDLAALTHANIIKVGIEGEEWFANPRGKTDVLEVVPILPIVRKMLDKYRNHPYCVKRGCLFPIKTNQNYNASLKETAIICNIPRVLKTHLARHTFGDIMIVVEHH